MPDIPANFIHRQTLHDLIGLADRLLWETRNPLIRSGLESFLRGACRLDGAMAQLVSNGHPNYKALRNPKGWPTRWSEQTCDIEGKIRFTVASQYLVRTDGSPDLPTGWYKLIANGNETLSDDPRHLRYLLGALGVPEEAADRFLPE